MLAHCPHNRRIAPVACAEDADAVLVRDALCDRPACRVGEIVLHLAAPLSIALVHEIFAVAAAAAVVHLEYRIAILGEKLSLPIEAPGIARAEGLGVRKHDELERSFFLPRSREIAMQRQAVARLQLDRLFVPHA